MSDLSEDLKKKQQEKLDSFLAGFSPEKVEHPKVTFPISTSTNTKSKPIDIDTINQAFERLKQYEQEICNSMNVSKGFYEAIKKSIPERTILIDDEEFELPFNLTAMAGIKIDCSESLGDHIVIFNYRGGSKEIFDLKKGTKYKIPAHECGALKPLLT